MVERAMFDIRGEAGGEFGPWAVEDSACWESVTIADCILEPNRKILPHVLAPPFDVSEILMQISWEIRGAGWRYESELRWR